MTESWDGAAPTRDDDAVETDAHAVSSAEELDEDRLRLDPLEAGMDPPERYSGVDRYGMTAYEQAHPRGIDGRVAEEEPDVGDEPGSLGVEPGPEIVRPPVEHAPADGAGIDEEALQEAEDRGQAADEAGGSVAAAIRTADEPE